MIRQGGQWQVVDWNTALAYVAGSVALSLLAVALGAALARGAFA